MRQQQSRAELSMCLCLCLCVLLTMSGSVGTVAGANDLSQKCGQVVQKVIPCLSYATGKAATPTTECCDAVTKIKDSDPECLCYIIQQTHKGSPESKNLGIQEDKLLKLPSACNVKNASISNCPKLLGLSPSSPDAAIFTNASAPGSPAGGGAAATETSTPQSQNGSFGSMLRPSQMVQLPLAFLLVVVPISEFVSIYTHEMRWWGR